jgi:hypothetical protein
LPATGTLRFQFEYLTRAERQPRPRRRAAIQTEHARCLHSDPQFPDCEPDRTQHLVSWLSFFEGRDFKGELKRIEDTGWFRGG